MSERQTTGKSLRELLARLHERLSQAASVDAESRNLLLTLMRDIDRALGRGRARGAAVEREHVPRLEALALKFEAGHPALAEVLRDIVDALGKAGI